MGDVFKAVSENQGPLYKIGASLLKSKSAFDTADAYREFGKTQANVLNLEAQGMEQQAGQERALGILKAHDQAKKGKLVQSALRARAAASGAGGSPDVMNLAANISAETEYRKALALYTGEQSGRNYENTAAGRRYSAAESARAGKIRGRAMDLQGYTSLITEEGIGAIGRAGGSLWKKYGEFN